MQAKFAKSGYVSALSGYSHVKSPGYTPKTLDLDGFDVQMLKPEFLQAKTLKRPLKQMDIHLKKTNPNGTRFQQPMRGPSRSEQHIEIGESNKNIKINQRNNNNYQSPSSEYQFISCSGLNIQPANRPKQKQFQYSQSVQLQFKDKNSIIAALFKKGQLKTSTPIQIKITKAEPLQPKVGPAQAKLKALYKKQKPVAQVSSKKIKQAKHEPEQIDEQINESIIDQYGNEEFEKMSGAYESQIKQSIRQSIIGGSSGAIKESIHDEIPESIRSGYQSRTKEQVKQQINQSLPKQNIEQEVYEQIFEQASISDEALKSKSNSRYLKKPKEEDKFELSVSASKGFRTKTTNVVKSIKFAEQLQIQKQIKNVDNKLQQKLAEGDKLAEQIIKQKAHIDKLHAKVSGILDTKNMKVIKHGENKNLDLLHNFKIEVNRLITSQNFMSKLRRLTAFLGSSSGKSGSNIVQLQDKLLNNLYDRIKDLRVSGVTQDELAKTKKQYDEKLAYLLKQQQMSLKIQMDRKLHEKDMELKKMIAELQQKMRTSAPISLVGRQVSKNQNYGDKVQVDSDYSIQSDQVSWKMDLWQILPDYEKKKLYEKQGAEVAQFLTDVLMRQIKDQNLDRSADISFQFPQQFNTSSEFTSKSNQPKIQKPAKETKQAFETMKPAFNRQQILSQVKSKTTDKQYDFPPLPGVKKKSQQQASPASYNIGFLQIPPKSHENQIRDTLSVSEVVKILAKYKNVFLKKKNDFIRKITKMFQTKTKADEPLSSILNQVRILSAEENKALGKDEPFVKAYQQQLIMELMAIFNKLKNRKNAIIQEQMKKMYDRIVVTCQIKTAQASVGMPISIAPHQNYIELRMAQEDRKVKDALVSQICNILALEFAKQMPKRK